ncbi:Uncharacterised protein [Mycobacteroides abscessus subsp. abscessus]|nr:Uncharacterised protein [Mycobacteroides abscessus subsp. abscessus]
MRTVTSVVTSSCAMVTGGDSGAGGGSGAAASWASSSPSSTVSAPPVSQARTTFNASIEAVTSWTRTPHTSCSAPSAVMTAVAVSRPSGGRSTPLRSVSSEPRNRLRDAPIKIG